MRNEYVKGSNGVFRKNEWGRGKEFDAWRWRP